MSVSPINAESTLLTIIWIASFVFFAISVTLCLWMTYRRKKRNRWARAREQEEMLLHSYISEVVRHRISPREAINDLPTLSASVMTTVLLHYFRTLKGESLEHLRAVISQTNLENFIGETTRRGVSGRRMRALKVLSYLTTDSSLRIIRAHLKSDDKYVVLTAARSLVRRKSLCDMDAIITTISRALPGQAAILSALLAGFGLNAVKPLETYISQSDESVIITACLSALVAVMPARTELDLNDLTSHPDERVRAAALSLSAICEHSGQIDPIAKCLGDSSIEVKIAASKIAHDSKRQDIVSELFALSNDPIIWVRYWALKAIWRSGQAGQKFVRNISQSNRMARDLILELESGYV